MLPDAEATKPSVTDVPLALPTLDRFRSSAEITFG
jgi:hypothetical protein